MNHEKYNLSKGLAGGHPCALLPARRRASHPASQAPSERRRDSGRRWGLHLVRRSGIFHFRRRWPVSLRALGAPEFLSLSLRTHLLADAVKRSADLLAALETGERQVQARLVDGVIDGTKVRALLGEMVRAAMADLLARLDRTPAVHDGDRHLTEIAAGIDRVGAAQRSRDWSLASALAAPAAVRTGVAVEDLATPAVARQILSTMRRLLDLARKAEAEGEDPLHLGRELLADHGIAPRREALAPAMLLSEAIEAACAEAPAEVEIKIRTVGRVALAFFGDVPVATLTLETSFEFLRTLWQLPKAWGKSHGRNRHGQSGRDIDPLAEIRAADDHDRRIVEAVLADDGLSWPDKRRRLVHDLTPRLTDGYLVVQRDMFQRIVRAALGAHRVGRDLDDGERIVPSHRQLNARLVRWHKEARTSCGLPTRVSRPKRRRSWSLEHLALLLTSPLYVGTSSRKQRWRKATSSRCLLQRDALYWVPLFLVTMGLRPEEILQLRLKDIIRRDGVICLQIGEAADAVLKNEQSRRILPIPEIVLRLGFRDWVVEKLRQGETWAFPEVQPDSSHGRRSQIFGDRLRTLFGHLDLNCPREDVYAMRRTLSSKLLHLGTDTGVRQRILGHLEGSTVDRHYSDDGLKELKAILDSVDYGIEVGRIRAFAFPVITGCATPGLPPLEVEVTLADRGGVAGLRLTDPEMDEVVFEARVRGASSPRAADGAPMPVLDAKDVANRVLDLGRTHALTMPASDEAVAAIDHLLILGDVPIQLPPASGAGLRAVVREDKGRVEPSSTRSSAARSVAKWP